MNVSTSGRDGMRQSHTRGKGRGRGGEMEGGRIIDRRTRGKTCCTGALSLCKAWGFPLTLARTFILALKVGIRRDSITEAGKLPSPPCEPRAGAHKEAECVSYLTRHSLSFLVSPVKAIPDNPKRGWVGGEKKNWKIVREIERIPMQGKTTVVHTRP